MWRTCFRLRRTSDAPSLCCLGTASAFNRLDRLLADDGLRERLREAAGDVATHYRESVAVTDLADRLIRMARGRDS